MTEIQKKLLDMLVWFDGFCRANNLRYYALGGTLLGACLRNSAISSQNYMTHQRLCRKTSLPG